MSLHEESLQLIPGGSNLYSKRPELYSSEWPSHYAKAKGIEIADTNGRTYLDFSTMGLGACVLGYADEDVDTAVLRTIARGSACSLNCPEEIELAKLLTTIHPWAQQCKFTRSGGEAIAVAIRIAQAYTGRTYCFFNPLSYHGWHVNDPRNGAIFLTSPYGKTAAIITEPSRLKEPEPGYLQDLRDLANEEGAVLIFDEISSGFRRNLGGVHLTYGVTPDIAVFSKAMSNGYPMAAVIGTKEVMQAAEKTFISSTSWSERIGPTAAIATIQKFWASNVHEHLDEVGYQVQQIWKYAAKQSGLNVTISGPPQLSHIEFESAEIQTLYTQLMLEKGFLAGRDFYPSYAHTCESVEEFLQACNTTFEQLAEAKAHDVVAGLLKGPVARQGVRR